jgi:hypothetical protein
MTLKRYGKKPNEAKSSSVIKEFIFVSAYKLARPTGTSGKNSARAAVPPAWNAEIAKTNPLRDQALESRNLARSLTIYGTESFSIMP